jgi:FKBP-type peptidyl-prolyl cis-trans isomerase FkpA
MQMKMSIYFLATVAMAAFVVSCNSVDFKKTKSGLVYKIFPKGKTSDSLAKDKDILKYHSNVTINDSLIYSSYGKMPGYAQLNTANIPNYSPAEIFPMLRKGDSAVVVLSIDTLMKSGIAQRQFPFAKKGDQLTITYKVLEIFHNDSTAQADVNIESEKDRPRQQKEMLEQQAKRDSMMKVEAAKEEEELRKSGEIDRELKAMESYLAKKNINAQKTGKGTYVVIKDPGNGPAATLGKQITVKYSGRRLENDSTFETNSYTFVLGTGVIQGWTEGLQLFRQGGKGTLYIPGFLAYGRHPNPGSPFKEFDPLIFDVEITEVKDVPAN